MATVPVVMILCVGNQAMDPQSPTGICSNAALQEQICFFDTMERQIWLGNTLLLVSATMAVQGRAQDLEHGYSKFSKTFFDSLKYRLISHNPLLPFPKKKTSSRISGGTTILI